MLAHKYLHDALLKVFVVINLNLSKPLRKTLAELIVCLLDMLYKIYFYQIHKKSIAPANKNMGQYMVVSLLNVVKN
jgi:hypothetical protein